jgi:hypothetical protein
MQEQLSIRGEKLYESRRSSVELRERLATLKKRYDALQESYEESQKMLASALDRANGGDKNGVELPLAVSVRNESIVVQRLQELTELITEWHSKTTADVCASSQTMDDERKRYREHMKTSTDELERLMTKLTVKTKK